MFVECLRMMRECWRCVNPPCLAHVSFVYIHAVGLRGTFVYSTYQRGTGSADCLKGPESREIPKP